MFDSLRAKARRGELRIGVPTGYIWHREIGLGFDPDLRLQEATLKKEEIHESTYRNLAQARSTIGAFLEIVYNRQRLHSALDYQSPDDYEVNLARLQGVPRDVSITETCPYFVSHVRVRSRFVTDVSGPQIDLRGERAGNPRAGPKPGPRRRETPLAGPLLCASVHPWADLYITQNLSQASGHDLLSH
jgi:hypothetical protein